MPLSFGHATLVNLWKSQSISTPDTARCKRLSIQLPWQRKSGLIIHNTRLMGGNYPALPASLAVTQKEPAWILQ